MEKITNFIDPGWKYHECANKVQVKIANLTDWTWKDHEFCQVYSESLKQQVFNLVIYKCCCQSFYEQALHISESV